ncbi:unnamed protein product [Lactuca virosa]|uniref:Uncharacterized protein n=1 Tax=Lactuca virosa TaxID=75947 RepID=A0AAU9NEV8_9ASTR|nr:unnamed protein product [Lactuca virosa]
MFDIETNKVNITKEELKTLAMDETRSDDMRIKALLLLVIYCFIIPSCCDRGLSSRWLGFVENSAIVPFLCIHIFGVILHLDSITATDGVHDL